LTLVGCFVDSRELRLNLNLSRSALHHRPFIRMATVIAPSQQLTPHPLPILPELANERVVCHCLNVTAGDIRSASEAGEVETLRAVMDETRAGTGCTCCHPVIRHLLDE